MRLALPQPVLAPRPAPVASGLDHRFVARLVVLAAAAAPAWIAPSPELVNTLPPHPVRVATLLALTLALQLFSVRVYGRGSVSVSAIGILASAFLFDTGTTMVIAVLAAAVQTVRSRRRELHKTAFDIANFAVSAGV